MEVTGLSVDQAAESIESLLAAEDGDNGPEEKEAEPEEAGEDAEPEESEEPEEAEAEDEDEDQPTYTVKIDGKEVKVKADELVAGYQRNADYTRKTQEIAEQRKAASSELENARAERAHYAQQLEAVSNLLKQNAPQQPDWDRLVNENPAEYLRQQRIHQLHEQRMQAVESERQQAAERTRAEEEAATTERIAKESEEMVKAIPEWRNPKVATAEKAKLAEFAIKSGYGPDDVAQINDHRVVVLLRKAMLFDQINAQRANLRPAQVSGPRTAQPGTTSRGSSEQSRARQRLAKSGSIEDAAKVFESFL